MWYYWYGGLRRVYGRSARGAVAELLPLTLGFGVILFAYRFLLFFTAFYTT